MLFQNTSLSRLHSHKRRCTNLSATSGFGRVSYTTLMPYGKQPLFPPIAHVSPKFLCSASLVISRLSWGFQAPEVAVGQRPNLGPVQTASQLLLPNKKQLPLPPVLLDENDQLLFCKVLNRSSFCAVQAAASESGVEFFDRFYLDRPLPLKATSLCRSRRFVLACMPVMSRYVQLGCCHSGHVPVAPWRDVTWGCVSLLYMVSGGPDPDALALDGVLRWTPFGSGVGGAFWGVPRANRRGTAKGRF